MDNENTRSVDSTFSGADLAGELIVAPDEKAVENMDTDEIQRTALNSSEELYTLLKGNANSVFTPRMIDGGQGTRIEGDEAHGGTRSITTELNGQPTKITLSFENSGRGMDNRHFQLTVGEADAAQNYVASPGRLIGQGISPERKASMAEQIKLNRNIIKSLQAENKPEAA